MVRDEGNKIRIKGKINPVPLQNSKEANRSKSQNVVKNQNNANNQTESKKGLR